MWTGGEGGEEGRGIVENGGSVEDWRNDLGVRRIAVEGG